MNRKIPNKPHPTPDPEKSHSPARTDRSSLARSIPGIPGAPEPLAPERDDAQAEEPTYDSCFDDLNVVLSRSMQEPDPDPNLEPAGEPDGRKDGIDSELGRSSTERVKPPRTSEIFRSVVALESGSRPPAGSSPEQPGDSTGDEEMTDLGVIEAPTASTDSAGTDEGYPESKIPWGQIALLSYASVLTLALIWLLWTGRIPKAAPPGPPADRKPASEPALQPVQSQADAPAPPLPSENIADLGRPIRVGDLEVTPLAVEAGPVELVRAIDSDDRKSEDNCLLLRLRLVNRSNNQTFTPIDRNLVRERDIRAMDPYIATSDGRRLRLFPLARDSEWSILGQGFPSLAPGESGETFVASEPGSATEIADEMTWRVRLRIGVYRSDMIGVKFTRSQVRPAPPRSWDVEQ